MKHLLYILCLFVLSCDSGGDESSEVEGCTSESANNFDEDATVDDGSCLCSENEILLWNQCFNKDLTSLNLTNIELQSSIPPEIGQMINLTEINISAGENLVGQIPPEIGDLINLTKLILKDNYLSGEIPSEIGNLTNLIELSLYTNSLNGEIPEEIWNLENLTHLELSQNELTGEISSNISNLKNLRVLALSNNKFSGQIPVEICTISSLFYDNTNSLIYIGGNSLCPPYPFCFDEYFFEGNVLSYGNQTCP